MRLILDCNVHRLPAASELTEIEDQLLMWGPFISASRIYRLGPTRKFKPEFAAEFGYVPKLGEAAASSGLEFFEYWLVNHERRCIPESIDWLRRDIDALFGKTYLNVTPAPTIIRGSGVDDQTQVRGFIRSIDDARLQSLIRAFGPRKSSQDAFHFWICERYGLDGILTLDAKLKRKVDQLSRKLRLRPRAYLPSDLCKSRGIAPVKPDWFAHSPDPFSGNMEVLFERRATLSDRFTYWAYLNLKNFGKRFGCDIKFRIPGYEKAFLGSRQAEGQRK